MRYYARKAECEMEGMRKVECEMEGSAAQCIGQGMPSQCTDRQVSHEWSHV